MKRSFTLLEVMIAFALLVMASSIIGVKTHRAVRKKKFRSQIERLADRLFTTQKLAVSMQADWKGRLEKVPGGWEFSSQCIEPNIRQLKPLKLDSMDVRFNDRRVSKLEIDFYSTGVTKPDGVLKFSQDDQSSQLKISEEVRR